MVSATCKAVRWSIPGSAVAWSVAWSVIWPLLVMLRSRLQVGSMQCMVSCGACGGEKGAMGLDVSHTVFRTCRCAPWSLRFLGLAPATLISYIIPQQAYMNLQVPDVAELTAKGARVRAWLRRSAKRRLSCRLNVVSTSPSYRTAVAA